MSKKTSLSISTLMRCYGVLGSIDVAKQAGADAIDFSLTQNDYTDNNSIYAASQGKFNQYFKNIKRYADSKGIEIAMAHGRMVPFRENDDEYNNVIFPKNAELDLKAAKILGAPICVFHPGGTLDNLNATPEEMRENAFNAYKMILPIAKEYGVKIAMETVGANFCLDNAIDFFGEFEEFLALYNRIEAMDDYKYKDYFSCCIDTGHINLAVKHGQPNPGDFIRKMGDRVSCLHMHDNDGYRDQHRMICAGTLNWLNVFNALDEIGYKGYYNSETAFDTISRTFMVETAEFTVKLIKEFLSNYN